MVKASAVAAKASQALFADHDRSAVDRCRAQGLPGC
jgi:hypothetical protein